MHLLYLITQKKSKNKKSQNDKISKCENLKISDRDWPMAIGTGRMAALHSDPAARTY